MVQEIDGLKYTIVSESQEMDIGSNEEEEIPPLPVSALLVPKLTPEEEEGKNIYDTAITLLNKTKPNKKEAYSLLLAASQKGNVDAKAMVAWATLFGNPLSQDVENAKSMFTELSEKGHHEGHMGLGMIHCQLRFTYCFYNIWRFRIFACRWIGR